MIVFAGGCIKQYFYISETSGLEEVADFISITDKYHCYFFPSVDCIMYRKA